MKNRSNVLLTVILLFLFSFLVFTDFINFDTTSAILFLIIVAFLVLRNKKILDFQIMLGIFKLPLVYAVLWRTKFGLKFMDKIANKYREIVKLLGYCFVGFGFFGMLFISVNVLFMLFNLFVTPKETSQNVSLILPLTNIAGIGYLSFWHFLITIFITVLIHEFAHGIVARAHNIPVKSSGLGVFSLIVPLFPLAFVEPDEKKLQKEKDIVQYSIFAAGPLANIIFAFIVLLFTSLVMIPVEDNITHPIGFSFNSLIQNYSAEEAGMQPGMIISNINEVDVLSYQDFNKEFGKLKTNQELTIRTKNGTFTVTTKPSPDDPKVGFIGISGIRNERRINEKYKSFGGIFFWLKGLIKWLYLINLAIGLMNLLPLMITDGGRMLKTALEKIFNNSKKADKVWVFIGVIFIFTLLFALVVKYGLQFFSFIGLG